MNYNKLKYFYEISKIQNLTKAAKFLYVSQSSLSKTISDLEKDFGIKLFYRSNKRIALTPAGAELFKQVEPFFSQETDIYSKVRFAGITNSPHTTSKLKIGYLAYETGLQIISFLPKFRERHPNIEIQLKRFNKNPLEKALHNHRVDLACLLFNIEQINSSIKYKIIDERHLAIILNKKHPYSHRKTLSLPELENELFILLGHPNTSAEYHTVIDWCIRCGFQPRIIDSFDYVEVLLMQIENSNYITILSDNSPYIHYNNLSCIPLENAPILYDGFLWNDNNDNTINDNINLFINQYQNYLQEISFYKK